MREMPKVQPVFFAQLVSLYDGDTPTMKIWRFFGDESKRTLRLLEVDCPEIRAKSKEEKEAARAAKDFALSWFAEASVNLGREGSMIWPFVVQASEVKEKYGRTLAYVFRKSDGDCLNDALNREGHGTYVPLIEHLARLKAP